MNNNMINAGTVEYSQGADKKTFPSDFVPLRKIGQIPDLVWNRSRRLLNRSLKLGKRIDERRYWGNGE